MSTGKIVGIVVLALVVLIGIPALAIWSKYTGAYDIGVNFETKLDAQWNAGKSQKSGFEAKVREILQVANISKDAQIEIIQKANEARYSKDGSKAMMQWLKEQNPTLDNTIYVRLAQVIDAGREDFIAQQKLLIEVKRQYTTAIDKKYFLGEGWWLELAGFPKADLSKYKVITLENVEQQFATGKDEVMSLK